MKHLIKFEELDYSTYMSAADKLQQFGQSQRAKDLRTHAVSMARKFADENTFGILVGDVREFPEAKFVRLEVFTKGNTWCLRGIFESGQNTHRVDAEIMNNGDIVWKEGNRFLDRKSTQNFQRVISDLCRTQTDFHNFFQNSGLTPENLKLVSRTFYN